MAGIALRGRAVMIGLRDFDAGRQPLLLLFRERNIVDALTEAHHERWNIGVLEHLHLVIADEHGDIGPDVLEHPRHFRHGALARIVSLLLGGKLDLLLEIFLGAQLRQFLELERAVAIGQGRIAPIGFDALVPLLGRRRQQRAVRGAHAQYDLCHGSVLYRQVGRSPITSRS